jgi:hypothetical protein
LLKRDPANTVPAEEAFYKVQQARELPAPVYGWFIEGFDTCDLKEAKALLEELLTSPRRLCCILLVVQGGRTAGRMTALYE